MAEREALTAAYVRSILHYDPETGVFTWRERPREHFATARTHSRCNTMFAGKKAGHIDKHGYEIIVINQMSIKAHRLAWFWMTGEWPKEFIDHINRSRKDNRWVNLREATYTQNQANSGSRAGNCSGSKGVHWDVRCNKWRVQIRVKGIQRHLGLFDRDKLSAAKETYRVAAVDAYGEFAGEP